MYRIRFSNKINKIFSHSNRRQQPAPLQIQLLFPPFQNRNYWLILFITNTFCFVFLTGFSSLLFYIFIWESERKKWIWNTINVSVYTPFPFDRYLFSSGGNVEIVLFIRFHNEYLKKHPNPYKNIHCFFHSHVLPPTLKYKKKNRREIYGSKSSCLPHRLRISPSQLAAWFAACVFVYVFAAAE